ncbi:RICIN domain-containing protein [Aquimarina agarivorans]|uniref:RICIN domain-containing protein n=1 Tax=Aquimarina agarivorans TaxID=980584 RepID=UPI000248F8A5|nr:RICIN domain-containing protein [Aquimarina agarivorans]
MKTTFNSKNLKLGLLQFLFISIAFGFNANSQNRININSQFNLSNVANGELVSLEFTSRGSFGCCGTQTVFMPIIADGGRLEAETATDIRTNSTILRDFQKWKFVSLGNNIYQIINVRLGRAIDVQNNNALPSQQQPNRSDIGQR